MEKLLLITSGHLFNKENKRVILKAMMNHTDLYIHFNVYSQQCYVSFCLVFVLSQKHDKKHTLYNKIN